MRWLVPSLLGCSLLALGCGSKGAACSATFTPCGGDLVGTWTVESTCNVAAPPMQCPGVTVTISPNESGTLTFNADETFSMNLKIEETGTATVPASCLTAGTSCSMLGGTTTAQGVTVKTTCTGTLTAGCTCSLGVTGTVALSGTYATAGSDVSLTTGGTPTSPVSYCVSGSQLQLGSAVTGQPSNSTYTIFSKQ
jgi:hypothetical protein